MVAPVLILLIVLSSLSGLAASGYQFLEGVTRTTIKFELYKDLIVIPAKINDSLKVRLILDTGTRSMLLYGKRFAGLQNLSGNRHVKIAGWGSPEGVDAAVSFPNTIRIGHIRGEALGIAVVSSRSLFADKPRIDGIIGYELFVKFVVEIDYKARTIYLYEKMPNGHAQGFTPIPLEINKAMPQVQSRIVMNDKTTVDIRLLIDTGSSLGLTLFSKDKFAGYSSNVQRPVGIGLNGIVRGFDLYFKHLFLSTLKVKSIPSHLVTVEQHPDDKFSFCGSIGAAFLKKHIVIFDYPSSRMFLLPYKAAKAVLQIVDLPS
ncbi:MAG TPA: aspartyl protease family protein [Cyclobacteriaceae bacterium]|nr:aspartyl protease family protein [Cyclobacteriaceae bacterium]